MTFQDTADGLFAPGVRYTEKLFEWFRPGEESLERGCREGHGMEFVQKTPRYRRDNHPSCYEYADRSEADLLRSVGKGVLEGPLHYEPWSVTPLGSIYQPEKDKFRNVWNARASRVDESLEPASADYDYLEDILKHQRPACWQHGWDLSDAFWNNPRYQPHCDYMGVMTPVSKEFYRAHYDMFGFCDAPKHQAEMARVFKRMLNGTVHMDGKSQCSGIFVDDGHSVADSDLSLAEATVRTQAEIAQLEAAGIRVLVHKTHRPSTGKAFIGREIDSVSQQVGASEARVQKNVALAEALEQQYPLGTPVPRRELAAVVGEFQFLAPLIRGGQNMLTPLYRARDRFTDPAVATRHAAAQWEDRVTVEMGREARDALGQFCQAFRSRPTRRYYLEKDPSISGWWTGQHSGDRDYLTEHLSPGRLEGSRVLLRTDNTTTMSITNRQGTMSPELWPIVDRMFKAAIRHDLDLAAEHIPGVENGLADGLSRFIRQKDYSDWQYRADELYTLPGLVGHPFTLDGGADPVGTNAYLPRHCSVVDSFLERDYCPEASHLFTSPEWRHLLRDDGTYGFGAERAFRGPTRWPVLVVHFPSTLPSTSGVTAAQAARGPADCGGVGVGLTGLIFCSRCWARRAGVVHCTGRMAALVSELLGMRTRLSTDEGHRRGIRDVEAYMRDYLDHGLPATGTDVVCYAAYSLVQPFMAEIAVVARGHGRGAGFAVETVHGVGGDGGITEAAEARGALLGSALGGGARRVRASEMSGLTGTVPTELGELTRMSQLAEPRCRVGLVVYAVSRLPLGGGEGPARRQGGRELHLGAGSPQGYSHAAARRTCGCIMMPRNALAGGVAEGPSPAHVAARGCGGTACAMERDETRRHLQAAEARGALLGSALGGGARRVRASEMSGWGARLGGCEMRGMLGRGRDRHLHSNSLTGTVPTELGELTGCLNCEYRMAFVAVRRAEPTVGSLASS
ncbi:hypothetical protein CYMTET_13454 [Cymbomonas tetramitiformis]|uniref:Uncharacterized protein n=1 Tax=Cymbomonas tetramitiformis TaxID=36881 RepID=A0AAE0LBD2_9CHLO|nr:hypothetical protein CYMTET_13454 [Cymbomonas tetramitiformis]